MGIISYQSISYLISERVSSGCVRFAVGYVDIWGWRLPCCYMDRFLFEKCVCDLQMVYCMLYFHDFLSSALRKKLPIASFAGRPASTANHRVFGTNSSFSVK